MVSIHKFRVYKTMSRPRIDESSERDFIKVILTKDQGRRVFLVEAHLKPVLGYSSKVGHCEVDFHNVRVELHQISVEI